MKKIKAEILATVTSRQHNQTVHPAGPEEEPNYLVWEIDDTEDGAALAESLAGLDEKGYIKIVEDPQAKPKRSTKPTKAEVANG